MEGSGTILNTEMDWTDAYYGGNCLKVSGNFSSDNHLKLFKTSLLLSSDSKLSINFKGGASLTNSLMKVGISFER